MNIAARHVHHAHARHRIWRSRLRKTLLGHRGRVGKLIHQGIFLHCALVELQQRDFRRIRRPPIGRLQIQFLRIDPIQLAVAYLLRTSVRKLSRFSARRTHHPHIVLAQKAHPSPIRRNFRVIDIHRPARRLFAFAEQLFRRFRLQVVPKQFLRRNEKQRLPSRRPQISRRLDPPQARRLPARSRRQQHIPQMPRVHQDALLPGRCVHSPDLRPARIVIQISKELAIGTPHGGAQRSAAQAGRGINTLDRELLLRAGLRCSSSRRSRPRQSQQRECRQTAKPYGKTPPRPMSAALPRFHILSSSFSLNDRSCESVFALGA